MEPYALIARAVSARTRALYLCTPNNPDGLVLDEAALAAIAKVAEQAGLWILADEVYEHYTYDKPHVSIASLPGMAARTLTVGSFSKSYGQAGLRVGYVAGPRGVIEAVRKMSNHSIYNVPHALQRAALASLRGGDEFLRDARTRYRAARDKTVAALKLPVRVPEGSTYLFVNFAGHGCGVEGCLPVLERIASAGVLLAPGAPFGLAYADWARLCFTAVNEERLLEGVERINRVL
jgi:aspartate/methionine/tyrosine aminotransferase